jgi:hypothetical protein
LPSQQRHDRIRPAPLCGISGCKYGRRNIQAVNRNRFYRKIRLPLGLLGVAVTLVFNSDLGRHLLGELRELLGLRGYRLELLARMRGRQLDKLRRDAAFDQGLVSFGDDGKPCVSPSLGEIARRALAIETAPVLRGLLDARVNLAAHRARRGF